MTVLVVISVIAALLLAHRLPILDWLVQRADDVRWVRQEVVDALAEVVPYKGQRVLTAAWRCETPQGASMARLEARIDIRSCGKDTYDISLDYWGGKTKTIPGVTHVDILLKAAGVPSPARAKVIADLRAQGSASTGLVELYTDELRRVGLM